VNNPCVVFVNNNTMPPPCWYLSRHQLQAPNLRGSKFLQWTIHSWLKWLEKYTVSDGKSRIRLSVWKLGTYGAQPQGAPKVDWNANPPFHSVHWILGRGGISWPIGREVAYLSQGLRKYHDTFSDMLAGKLINLTQLCNDQGHLSIHDQPVAYVTQRRARVTRMPASRKL
jgi:hypothetical protein